ncbi:hypothetical protein OH764_08420 [Burkholderia sp. M6-3]
MAWTTPRSRMRCSVIPAVRPGVAVLGADTPDAELDRLTQLGVRGSGLNLFRRDGQAVYRNAAGLDALRALAPKLAARGWHAQIWIHAPDLPEVEPLSTTSRMAFNGTPRR